MYDFKVLSPIFNINLEERFSSKGSLTHCILPLLVEWEPALPGTIIPCGVWTIHKVPANLHWQLSFLQRTFFFLAITAHSKKAKSLLNPASSPSSFSFYTPQGIGLSDSGRKGNPIFPRLTPLFLGLNYSLMTSSHYNVTLPLSPSDQIQTHLWTNALSCRIHCPVILSEW